MKNRVNFIGSVLRPQVVLINLNFLLLMMGVALMGIVLAYWLLTTALDASQQQVSDSLAKVQTQRALVETLSQAKQNQKQDPALLTKIALEQQSLSMKQSILLKLDKRETLRQNGFSGLMQDLANYHQQGLWLTQVTLDERHIALQGTANQSTALPQWIEKLSQAPYFVGREFAGARMLRDKDNRLDFVISSELDDLSGEGR